MAESALEDLFYESASSDSETAGKSSRKRNRKGKFLVERLSFDPGESEEEEDKKERPTKHFAGEFDNKPNYSDIECPLQSVSSSSFPWKLFLFMR